jgi:hypothetical protein
MSCLSAGDVWRINRFATHHFPIAFFVLHLTVVTVWFGAKTPRECQQAGNDDASDEDDKLFYLFMGYWILQCVAVLLVELWVGWKTWSSNEYNRVAEPPVLRLARIFAGGLTALLYFIGASFARLRPFSCFGGGDEQRIVGPILLWLTYSVYFWGSFLLALYQKQQQQRRASLGEPGEGGGDAAHSTLLPESLAHLELLLRTVAAIVRDKFPLFTLLAHYTVILLFYGSREDCETVNLQPFLAYLCLLLLGRFLFCFLREYVTISPNASLPPPSPGLRVGRSLFDALQGTALLVALVFNRAYPLRCVGFDGIAMVYSVSIPLLWFSLLWSTISAYLQARPLNHAQLQKLCDAKDSSRVHH